MENLTNFKNNPTIIASCIEESEDIIQDGKLVGFNTILWTLLLRYNKPDLRGRRILLMFPSAGSRLQFLIDNNMVCDNLPGYNPSMDMVKASKDYLLTAQIYHLQKQLA